jgi:DNA-binding response OmpR family regulator
MAGRLLLVGELNDDLSELRIGFEALGLTVDVAPDGLAGLEQGREFQPDLLVTEILTNRLSGFELASRIRGGEAGFAAPVIFYTEFYRDEKARRDVLAKYSAIQYFVRPFQKEALKKSVAAHFQEFLSSLPAMPITASPPEPDTSEPELSTVVPQLSRAASAAEKQPASLPSRRPVQAGEVSGSSGEVPGHFRAFDLAVQAPASESAGTLVTPQAENQPLAVPVMPPLHAERVPTSPKVSRSERSLLLPVEEPSLIGRLARSIPVRIAAVVIVAALAVYLVRDQFQSGNQETSTPSQTSVSTQPSPTTQTTADPTAQAAKPTATVSSSTPPSQDPPVAAVPKAETDPATPPLSSSPVSTKEDAVKQAETADSRAPTRERSPALSIQDVTGSGRGPVLRKMKPIQLSQDMLSSLAAKPVVVRVVIDSAGKVTQVAPLNQEGTAVPLPPEALATIEQWEFSRSRRKEAGEAVKYFSLKVQNPRQ